MDKISIIIPVYNTPINLLKRCLESVINQTYKELEILIIDDGSTNECFQYCKSISKQDSRVVFNRQENKGVSAARNLGIELSTGKYIAFIDSDDYVDLNYIEALYKTAKRENADICFTSSNKIYKNSIERQKIYEVNRGANLVYNRGRQEFSPYNLDLMGTVWGKIYKRNLIYNMRFDTSIKFGEDILFNFMIFNSDLRYCYINEFLYQYVINETSTIRKFNEETVNYYENTIEKIKEYINSEDEEKYNTFLLYICTFYRVICMNYICNKENKINLKNKLLQMKLIRKKNNFKLGIDNANLKKMRFSRRIPILFARKNMFFLTYMILEFRNVQTRIIK